VIVSQGSGAFQLANPNWLSEMIVLNTKVTPTATTKLFLESRLTSATTGQAAKVEVSNNNGSSWTTLWTQTGTWSLTTPNVPETSFKLVTVPLAAYAGQSLSVRFHYHFTGAYAYTDTTTEPPVGWFIDNIQIGETFETSPRQDAGNPTPEEILLHEYINRARTNANTEALRLRNTTDPQTLTAIAGFRVDLNMMQSQFATLTTTVPPLAMSEKLTAAARLHTQDLFSSGTQVHVSTAYAAAPNRPGDEVGTRVARQGYNYQTVAENIYSYAYTPWDAHAGLNIDWGYGTGGMQTPPGHRIAMHNANYREIGVGTRYGTNKVGTNPAVGPFLMTQNFGARFDPTPILTGVAINDTNSNRFYDIGEGIPGVRVEASGITTYTTSSTHGAFSLALPTNGIYQITFRPPNSPPVTKTVNVTNGNNVKVDYFGEMVLVKDAKPTTNGLEVIVEASPNATFQMMKSGDLVNWTNTPAVTNTLTGGLTKLTPNVETPPEKLYFKVKTVWTNQ
jgi:hypothetical protein